MEQISTLSIYHSDQSYYSWSCFHCVVVGAVRLFLCQIS
ncbi:hypothetical protein LINGRAHAP2_LOCUS24812 [Linum grandiflorum]